MKKLLIVTQSKGGVGKSTFTFLYSLKHPDAVYLCCDDATRTTIKQLKYLNPKPISFLNSTKTIDRGLFNDFLEHISTHEKDTFLCDFGASISEQLPHYLLDHSPEVIKAGLDALNIEMHILCIIGGQNIFLACCDYLESLATACNSQIKMTIAINDHFPLSETQQQEFASFCKAMKLKDSFHFNLSKDKNLATQVKINDVLKEGNGLQNASVFTKILFESSIKNLPL